MTSAMKKYFQPLAGATALALLLCACATPPAAPVDIHLVGMNDFHGNLERSKFTFTSIAERKERSIEAGGIDTLAAALQAWRGEDGELVLVGAGDLVGASPAMSAMWADEPSITAMDLLGLSASAVGNHEFDQGRQELLRKQNGGCVSPRPDKACKFTPDFAGARFHYLAANVRAQAGGQPLLPAYRIVTAHGIKVGIIGAVLKDIAPVALASGIAGLDFGDEADAINAVLPQLRAQGVGVFVVLIHQGGHTSDYFDEPDCSHLQGPIVDVVKRLDPAIRLIVSGHTHKGYTCRVDGRVVTEADMGGHVLSRITLRVDPASNSVREVSARNIIMTPSAYPADPKADAFLAQVRGRSVAVLGRPVARIAAASVARKHAETGESALGDLVADSELAAARAAGAQIAFMNNGGMREDLDAGADLVSNVGQVRMVLPFGNTLQVMSLTGAQIRALLELQWRRDEEIDSALLQVSEGFSYRWDGTRPVGSRVLPDSVMLQGKPLEAGKTYRVAVGNFLAEGGDGFPIFLQGTERVDLHVRDSDALAAYLSARAGAGAPAGSAAPLGRIRRVR